MYRLLSIDIGMKNMSFAFISIADGKIADIQFEMFDLDEYGVKKKSIGIAMQRCTAIQQIFNEKVVEHVPNEIIIEKQVPSNENAMCIMYSLISNSLQILDHTKVSLFDPKTKFTTLSINYDTKNKRHKKLSIELCTKLLKNLEFAERLAEFHQHSKQDDIADAINQGIIWLYKNKILNSVYIRQMFQL